LFEATDGCNWQIQAGWLKDGFVEGTSRHLQADYGDKTYCTWHGITCDIVGNGGYEVTEINLSENNLVGTIPDTIGILYHLTQVVLQHNYLSGVIPTHFGIMNELQVLNVVGNSYNFTENANNGKMPTELCDPSDNTLPGLSLEVLAADCEETNYLSVFCECCTYCAESIFPTAEPTAAPFTLSPIPSLMPTDACVTEVPSDFSCDGYNLKTTCLVLVEFYISMNGCDWDFGVAENNERRLYGAEAWLSGSPETNSLDPFCNWYGISCEDSGCEVGCDVTKIDLWWNNLSGTLPPSLSNLVELRVLELGHNRIYGTIPDTFSQLINLRLLDLESNEISGTYNFDMGGICDIVEDSGGKLLQFITDCDNNFEVTCECCTTCGTNLAPSAFPSSSPTHIPTASPTLSKIPSASPSDTPSTFPSQMPTSLPSTKPSLIPSSLPSIPPSEEPSSNPTSTPTNFPSVIPSTKPTGIPSVAPSSEPSNTPSLSKEPSDMPSRVPSNLPTETCYEDASYRCTNDDSSSVIPLGASLTCPDEGNDSSYADNICAIKSCGQSVPIPSESCCYCQGRPINFL